jgi:ribosomal protein L16 Arg81 hydroxylase
MIELIHTGNFPTSYPNNPASLRYNPKHPLLERKRLIELSQALPDELVEFNPGNLPVFVDKEDVPKSELTAIEVIEKIGEESSWMALRNIERDDVYKAFIESVIDLLAPEIQKATGKISRREAFIFISSPGAVTPCHLDEEHNVLIQVEGEKEVTLFSADDRDLVTQQDIESFLSGGYRAIKLDPERVGEGKVIKMVPGDALYIPPLAPHFVKVLDGAPSLSLSVTWRSDALRRGHYLHQINHKLRSKGKNPTYPGVEPVSDQIKIWKESGRRRLSELTARIGS